MRVLLIIPTCHYKYEYPAFLSMGDFPAGFACLASALRDAGHTVLGLNLNNDAGYRSAFDMVYERLRRSLREFQPQLIGVGGLCTDFNFLKDAMRIIRQFASDVPVVCGGGIISNDAEFVFKLLHPDFCVIGEGEEVLVQLANMIQSGRQDYQQIPNIGYWKAGLPEFTRQDFAYPDINNRPFPDYDAFGIEEMLDKYSMAERYLYRYPRPDIRPMSIITARGCPFNCSFCVHQRRSRYRKRSIENIMREIALLYQRYHFNVLIFLDELFAANKAMITEFCQILLRERQANEWDFNWIFQTHASASLDRATLSLAKEAGCYCFSYGLESASPRVLASMNKKTKPSQILNAIQVADSVGMGFGGNLLFGDVAENLETVKETMDFFVRYGMNEHIYLGFVQPYPGSQLFEVCLERKIIPEKNGFYEHIDEHAWNMTSMPNKVWLPWLYLTYFFGRSFPWAKSTEATCFIEENIRNGDYGVALPGTILYKVLAECPHCHKEFYCRHMLGKVKQEKKPVLKMAKLFGNRSNRLILKAAVANAVFYAASCRSPLFILLKSVMSEWASAEFFVTGCPHCNKRVRINIPAKGFQSRLRLYLKKMVFKAVFFFTPSITAGGDKTEYEK